MQSELIQRTPSVYFKFEDENNRQFSKSSLVFDYSISHQKGILISNQHIQQLKSQNKLKKQQLNPTLTPCKQFISNKLKQRHVDDDEFQALYGTQNLQIKEIDSKLKTQQFFQQFQQNFVITFDQEQQIFVNQWNQQDLQQRISKISRGNLNFQEFQIQSKTRLISIQSRKNINECDNQQNQQNDINLDNYFKKISSNKKDHDFKLNQDNKTTKKVVKHKFQNQVSGQSQLSCELNAKANESNEFQEVISFGPKIRKQKKLENIGQYEKNKFPKQAQNLSNMSQKHILIRTKRRMPLKNIQNLIQKHSTDGTISQVRKNIINGQLFVSTVNKVQKSSTNNNSNGIWSNRINCRKSSSLEGTFNYDNMFKTNAFRETLKSITLENWKKKHHRKIQNHHRKMQNQPHNKTIPKKKRDVNIFQKLFIRG